MKIRENSCDSLLNPLFLCAFLCAFAPLRENERVMDEKKKHRDKVIADTGWGIKPDDQPSNRGEAPAAKDVVAYNADEPNVIRNLLRMQRRGFNIAKGRRADLTLVLKPE